jgi:preprotein translocase subunit YajC
MSDAGILSAVFVGVIIAFYLMFLRPIQKDQEKHRQQIRDLRPGDDVITTSGFIARVKDIQVPAAGQTQISLELADGVVFTAISSAIAQRITPAPSAEPTSPEQKGVSG